jgi:hypothetical protein
MADLVGSCGGGLTRVLRSDAIPVRAVIPAASGDYKAALCVGGQVSCDAVSDVGGCCSAGTRIATQSNSLQGCRGQRRECKQYTSLVLPVYYT